MESGVATDNVLRASPAGLARRLGALVYDMLLIIALWMCTLLPIVIINDGAPIQGVWVSLLLGAEWVLFYALFWHKAGQTLGMRAWRLKLVDAQGLPVGWRAIAIRLLAAPVSLGIAGLGYLWALCW